MNPKEMFARSAGTAAASIHLIQPEHLENETPCTDWNLKQLLNHMVGELLWMPELLRGKTIAEVGTRFDGNVVGIDPVKAWRHAVDAALVAVKQTKLTKVVHLSYGDVPAKHYISEMATEMLIHGWDVDQSLWCTLIFDEDLASSLYEHVQKHIKGYRDAGMVAAEVNVPAEASVQVKLLGLMGRRAKEF